MSERAGGDLAANFPRRGHGQDLAQVLARAHGGGLNTNFACGHQDRRKTNIVGGQPDTEKSPGGSHAIECHAVRHFRGGSHKCHMDAAFATQFLNHIGRGSIQHGRRAERFCKRELLV